MSTDSKSLSSTEISIEWIKQFALKDQQNAAELLDHLALFDEGAVVDAIVESLGAAAPSGQRIALYAEREFAQKTVFKVSSVADKNGRIRNRAIGTAGPPSVAPVRGSPRVGSEGWIAFLISQCIKTNPKRYLNHPGPDRLRKVGNQGVRYIAIVTDFIGSGHRICKQLDAFWAVPSVKSWHSMGLISFRVIAAATTANGKALIESHKTRPIVSASHVVPTVSTFIPKTLAAGWDFLANAYWPGSEPLGYRDVGALVAFSYGFPNNSPQILWNRKAKWRPLFEGIVPAEMRSLFGTQRSVANLLRRLTVLAVASLRRAILGDSLIGPERAKYLLFFSCLRGRFDERRIVEVAERSGLTVPEVLRYHADALKLGWISPAGRLTDSGRKLIRSIKPRALPLVIGSSQDVPYYPKQLRAS